MSRRRDAVPGYRLADVQMSELVGLTSTITGKDNGQGQANDRHCERVKQNRSAFAGNNDY